MTIYEVISGANLGDPYIQDLRCGIPWFKPAYFLDLGLENKASRHWFCG